MAGTGLMRLGRTGSDRRRKMRAERRNWCHRPCLVVLIDDYDLSAVAQGVRSSSGAGRAMFDPLLRRMWELGNPAPCSHTEGRRQVPR